MHTIVETFKVIKYHCPYSIYSLFKFNTKSNLLILPKIGLEISKTNYGFKACKLWNSVIKHVFTKIDIDSSDDVIPGSVNNLVIPGSLINSDFSASVGYVKTKLKTLLRQLQQQGSIIDWNDNNFDLSSIDGPNWTWGIE